MKRILSLVLCLVMLLGTVVLLASCGGEGDSGKTVEIDLAEYDLVRGESIAKSKLNGRFLAFSTALREATGLSKRFMNESQKSANSDKKEILVASAYDAQAAEAKAEIKGQGYTIKVTDNKIIIVGTTEYLTFVALKKFQTEYLSDKDGKGTKITVKEKDLNSDLAMHKLNEGEKFNFTFVYDDYIDDEGASNVPEFHGPDNSLTNPDQVDFAVHCCYRIAEMFYTNYGCKKKNIKYITDKDAPAEHEFQIGILSRDNAQANLAKLALNEYGFFTDENNIYLLSWSESTLDEAQAMMTGIIMASTVTEDGKKVCYLPKNITDIELSDEPVYLDIPAPEADKLTLLEYIDVYDDNYEYIYTGDGATLANYTAYCQKLESLGYVLKHENTIEKSVFRTYVNEEKKMALHVTFSAFAHSAEYTGKQSIFKDKPRGHCPYPDWPVAIRVTAAPILGKTQAFMDENLLNPNQRYEKITEPMITSINQKGTNSTNPEATGSAAGYIITLEDGSFFICDSGSKGGGTELFDILKKLYTKIHGHAPTKDEPIVIAGWYLTHFHGDHTGKMAHFARSYAASGLVKMEYVFVNLPSLDEQFNLCQNPAELSYAGILAGFADSAKIIKVHTGYQFYLRNTRFEVLYTHEDMHPFMLDYGNETSTVIRAYIENSDAAEGVEPTTFLMTGDMNRFTGWYLCGMYGNYLQSDQMTVAHHGWAGPYEIFYEAVDPIVLWWPNSVSAVKNSMMEGHSQGDWYQSHVDGYISKTLASVRYIFISDMECQTLVINKNGLDYKDLFKDMFNALTGIDIHSNGQCNFHFKNRDK